MPGSLQDAESPCESPRPPQAKISEILNKINKPDLLHAITIEPNSEWNDFLIPYTKEQLPKDKNGSLEYATEFMEKQNEIVSETFPISIQDIFTRPNQGIPPHIQTMAISDLVQVGEKLGNGRYGEVHTVELQASDSQAKENNSNVFAMKSMRKPALRGGSSVPRSTVLEFETELHHLSRCKHHHIIDLRASFTDEASFGFIVSPVAALTLQELLSDYVSKNHIDRHDAIRKALEMAFGCLLEAVHYLHDVLQIKHRDIKPRNILMDTNYRVVICDLGSAYDFQPLDRNESTEAQRPPGTRKYKAPEVLESIDSNERPRHNRKVDIFSLGCVFLEILTVLCEHTLDGMAMFISQDETTKFEGDQGTWTYATSLERADIWLDRIREPHEKGEGPTVLIRSMVSPQYFLRRHEVVT